MLTLRRRWQKGIVALALRSSGYPTLENRARRLAGCGIRWGIMAHRAHPERSRPVPLDRCKDRLCPDCARIRAANWASRIVPLLQEVRAAGRKPKFITLTQRARHGERIRAAARRLQRCFETLRHGTAWKKHVRAWVASREVTRSRGDTWHVHIHLVADAEYWPQAELSAEWERVTAGESRIVDIREAKDGVERELLKYTLKTTDVAPDRLVEFALAMRGARTVSTGGAWYGRVRDEDLLEDEGDFAETSVLLTFQELLRRVELGDSWAHAVKGAVDCWIARKCFPKQPTARAGPCRNGLPTMSTPSCQMEEPHE